MSDTPANLDETLDFLTQLLNIHSPTGMTDNAIAYCENTFGNLTISGMTLEHTRKGALHIHIPGENSDRSVGLTAHTDTLGLMVKEIKGNGRLKCTNLGGIMWSGIEFEGVTVFPSGGGDPIRGTVVPVNGSVHVNRSLAKMDRTPDSLEIRLDERTSSADETQELGIHVGDFVCLDPRVEIINGFIRSRFLDDKLSIACIYAGLKGLNGAVPAHDVQIIISNYEEVGHGGAPDWRDDLYELIAVDMAAVGDGQASSEYHCTLCVKDSGGPYSYATNKRIRRIAEANDIDLKIDIYPYYTSDGTAYWQAGGPARVGLIGPGVDSSHSYERSHTDALAATAKLITQYLLDGNFD
jgi:putative aminopeptidase FrvX